MEAAGGRQGRDGVGNTPTGPRGREASGTGGRSHGPGHGRTRHMPSSWGSTAPTRGTTTSVSTDGTAATASFAVASIGTTLARRQKPSAQSKALHSLREETNLDKV